MKTRSARFSWGIVGLGVALIGNMALGSTKQQEGIIMSVPVDYKSFKAQAFEYYGHKADAKVEESLIKPNTNCITTLDGCLTIRPVALVPGRWVYAYGSNGGIKYLVVLSESVFAPAGKVTKVEEGSKGMVVQMTLGATGLLDVPVTFGGDCAFLAKGAPAKQEEVMKVGETIRVTPGRAQTIRAISDESRKAAVPGEYSGYDAVVKSSDGATKCVLSIRKDGKWEDAPLEGKLPPCVLDARFVSAAKDTYTVGRRGVYVLTSRLGNPRPAFIGFTAEPGRVDGVIKEVKGDMLAVTTWDGNAVGETAVKVDPKAEISLDGKVVKLADLKPGMTVLVLPARKQQVEAIDPIVVPTATAGH